MKITTLGTSHGDPTPGHYCTSVLIETSGRKYLVDAGEPANATLVRMGLVASCLSGIFITHMHIDHTGGLPVLCEQAEKHSNLFPDVKLQVMLPEAAAVEGLTAWRKANHGRRFQSSVSVSSYNEGLVYNDGNILVESNATGHLAPLNEATAISYALKITSEGRKVMFSGDLASDFSDFPLEFANGCDLVFCEITHYPLEKALPVFAKLKTSKLIFYHIHNPWQTAEGQEKVLGMCANLPYPVEFSHDGFEVMA